ncbi:MAG: hypothetical protein RL329_2137 [Bacteroidota bacterium]|jgi:hypothetical protein
MNSTTVPAFSSLGEHLALQCLGEIIDSKIAFTEYESRKLFAIPTSSSTQGGEAASDVAKQPSSGAAVISVMNIFDFFAQLERLSKTLRWLEVFKIVMRSDNIYSILGLLENDTYLTTPDTEIETMLDLSKLTY